MKKKRFISLAFAWGEIMLIAGILLFTTGLIGNYVKRPVLYRELSDQTEETETESELMNENQAEPTISVQILSEDYRSEYHERVAVVSDASYCVTRIKDKDGALQETEHLMMKAEEPFELMMQQLDPDEILRIDGKESVVIQSFRRADGFPEYEGTIYVYREPEGLILINELPLENYLCSVVSSEMPSSYPLEAQKAQAICARTYAWKHMRQSTENPEKKTADLDDSVLYQVYNNFRATERSCEAVRSTEGQILKTEEPLYYSTSCLTEYRSDLSEEEAFRIFLEKEPEEFKEYGSPWLRWEVSLSCNAIQILERSGNGQVQKIRITTEDEEQIVEGEYQIRRTLSPRDAEICLRDGSSVAGMELLPSAFFYVEDEKEGVITLYGGGYGHGIGMSQYGAAQMAQEGKNYQEILKYYYGEEAVRQ